MTLSLLACVCLGLSTTGDGPAEWNRFRGPNGTGLARGGPYPVEIGPEQLVIWKRELAPGRSSPVLGVDHVYLTAVEEDKLDTLALDRDTGEELWRQERPRAVSGHCTPVAYTPDADGAQVILPGSYLLDAYDVSNGERVWWVRGLPSEMKSVPVVDGDTLWIHGYNVPMNDRGQQVILPPFDEALGERDDDGDGAISADEIDEPKVAPMFEWFDPSGDGTLDAVEWETLRALLSATNSVLAVRLGGQGDRTEEGVLRRYYRGIPQLPSPLVVDGLYYMLNDQGGLISLLDAESGELVERGRLADAADAYYTSPVAADGKVYLLSETGILTVLDREKGLEPVHRAEFAEACYATPALEDGRIWLRTQEHLYCFGLD